MAGFVKGDVVVIPFPFSDLSGSKKRPALVLADLPGDDIKDTFAVPLTQSDFSAGSLPVASNIRPTRIFTADKNIIIRKSGTIKPPIIQKVVNVLTDLLDKK